jgi:predicted ATP-grasp superfamily ATP-dependent carboligase
MPTNATPSEPRRILILDANQRSALAAVRSLGKLNLVYIYTADSSALALAGTSRYCREYHCHPSPHADYAAFSNWLIEFVGKHSIDFLLPMTEISSRSALALRAQLGTCILPFADLETVLALSDKWRLIELARRVDVPHPVSTLVANAAQLPALAAERFPLVIKPCLSRIFHGGQWLDTSVHIARSATELASLLREKTYLREHPFILQEFIPGHGAGIFALYNHGTPVAFFAHRRLREKPPSGGVSVLSESVPLDHRLLGLAKALLDQVQWHGVAMIEFRIGADGTPYLMEINTRFWGSLQLAIDAGVDFPRLLFDASINTHANTATGSAAAVSTPINYRYGRRLRWLLGDIDNLYLTLRSKQYSIRQKLSGIIQFLTPRPLITRHEINRLDDLKPAWFELKLYVRNFVGKS